MDNVHVAIRVRPLIFRESNHDQTLYWQVGESSIYQVDAKNKIVGKPYTFDYVFSMDKTTTDVYTQVAQPIIESAMDGYDGTIFAYGQTSSGKTFTMQGNDKLPGIIPMAISEIFETINTSPDREFLLRVYYMELYNEVITDLLCKDGKGLSIREHEKRVFVSGLTEEVVTSVNMIIDLMKKGDQQRHVGRTNMNEYSSRSHTIFCIIIESREKSSNTRVSCDGAVKVSRLNLVDLAGSERINDTKAEGMRLKEACNINQSLFALGQVINKLSSGVEYIPFRDSKLTRILQPSLGGNAKTAIICTVTPATVEQTHSTLQFASRAKNITNKPVMNEILSDEAMLRRYKSEIQKLKKQIDEFNSNKMANGLEALQNEKRQMSEENLRLIEARNHLENMVISSHGVSNQKTKKRPNRRETWCPGTRKFPLLASDPVAAAAALSAEVGTLNLDSFQSSIVESKGFVSFSETAIVNEDCLSASVLEDDFVPKKKKRRRAVQFADIPALLSDPYIPPSEVGCQTEEMVSEELHESIIICETLMAEKDQFIQVKERLQVQVNDLKEENQQVNSKHIIMQIEHEKVDLELKRCKAELVELQEFTSLELEVSNEHFKSMQENMQKQLQKLENEKSDSQVCFEIEKENNIQTCTDLRAELQVAYNQLDELRGEGSHKPPEENTPTSALQETIERLTKKCDELNEDLQLSITSSIEAQEDLIKNQDELEERTNECKTLSGKLAVLQGELEEARAAADRSLEQPCVDGQNETKKKKVPTATLR